MANNNEFKTALLPIDDITIPEISLRDVRKDSDEFLNLVQSIYDYGVIQTITVVPDPKNPDKYILEDGKHRLTGSLFARDQAKENKDKQALARVSLIPARIQNHSIDEIPFMQIQANLHRVETKGIEFARQIRRIWASPKFSMMTKQQLFVHLGIKTKSLAWFDQQLGLGNLIDEAEEALNEGKLNISAAYSLAKLPAEEQVLWLERAMTEKVEDFTNLVNTRIAEIKNEKRGIKKEKDPLDDIKPRKKTDFRAKIVATLEQVNNDPNNQSLQMYAQGLLWGCSMDQESVAAKEQKEKAEKDKRDAMLKLRREKLMAVQKAAMPGIEAEIKAALGT